MYNVYIIKHRSIHTTRSTTYVIIYVDLFFEFGYNIKNKLNQ